MKTTPIALAAAAVLAGGATAASAQIPTPGYSQAYQTYQQQQAQYQAQQQAYNAARAKYEADRSAYDARYGYGAYERVYGPFSYSPSTYSYGYGTTYPYSSYPSTTYPYSGYPSTTYPYGTTAPYSGQPYASSYPYGSTSNPYYAGAYGVNSAYGTVNPCTASTGSSVNLGALAAIASAALGGGGSSLGSIVNQAVLGSAVNSAIGSRTTSSVRCDSRGPYYTYSQTKPYREGYYDNYGRWVSTPTSTAYARCRIAPAPTDAYGQEYRYVRVCPDSSGRYRITS